MVDSEIASYADDSTSFSADIDSRSVVDELEISFIILFTWINNNFIKYNNFNNYIKANADKSHHLLSGSSNGAANIDGNVKESGSNQVILSITIDSNLSFNKHVNNFCKKTSAKLNALAKISGYLNLPKYRIIMKSFITSQFGYSPLIWMFHSRTLTLFMRGH